MANGASVCRRARSKPASSISLRGLLRTPEIVVRTWRAIIELQWYGIKTCPGVGALVMKGMTPARVPDQVIVELRSREKDGVIELPKPRGLRRGDRVKVTEGAFKGKLADPLPRHEREFTGGCPAGAVGWEAEGHSPRWLTSRSFREGEDRRLGRVSCLRQRMSLVPQPQLAESRRPTNDAMCQQETHAPQQNSAASTAAPARWNYQSLFC